MEKKPCAKCSCLSSEIKHKAFGTRGFVVICPCCEHRVDGSTKKEAARNWNNEFRMGEYERKVGN